MRRKIEGKSKVSIDVLSQRYAPKHVMVRQRVKVSATRSGIVAGGLISERRLPRPNYNISFYH